tara:strand:- start:5768 stop:6793 length:1026 start_codon:yes stop_codon:yes gene_type:complete
MNEENRNIYISNWLLLITILVAIMIVVGGLTRLTDSGLSITKWELFSGIIPPFSEDKWENSFSLYKEIPEYKLQNSSMTLQEFKVIYWWEYIHRLLGRIVGLFFLIPLIYFTYKKIVTKKTLLWFYTIFILILFQGFVGWYMVKSGLSDRTDVSHYRLSVHLTLAFIIFILTLWNYLKLKNKNIIIYENKIPYFLPTIFMLFTIVQISIGAFVSGLDAGQIYNSWPSMNGKFFPDDVDLSVFSSLALFDIPSIVQFIHRILAYLIFALFLFILLITFRNQKLKHLEKNVLIVFFALLIQIMLGIFTVLYNAQILIASLHQFGSIILITSSLILVYKNSKIN